MCIMLKKFSTALILINICLQFIYADSGNAVFFTTGTEEVLFSHEDLITSELGPTKGVADANGFWTCEFWLKMEVAPEADSLITASTNDRLNIGVDTDNKIYLVNNGTVNRSAAIIPLNQWTHIAIVKSQTANGEVFVDGVSKGAFTSSIDNGFRMSKLNPNGALNPLRVTMDELKIWAKARAASEIMQNMNSVFNSPFPGSLVFYYKFDSANGTTDLADTHTVNETVDVYILAGQSNMEGQGLLSTIALNEKRPLGNSYFWTGTMFERIIPGSTLTGNGLTKVGPEIGFTRKIEEENSSGNKICLIKHAVSGQPLHYGWDDQTWLGTVPTASTHRKNFYPGETQNADNMGLHYQNLKNKFTAALADLTAKGLNYQIKGIIWMQGEQDSKNATSATEYAKSLKKFKEIIQLDLGTGSIPLIYGQVLPHAAGIARFTNRDDVRQSMLNADKDSGHADAIAKAVMIPTEAYPHNGDNVHFNGVGQIELGREMAKQILLIQQ